MSRYSNPVIKYFLTDGSVASSGKLYFYENGSLVNKKDTWSDAAKTIPNTNPVLLSGEGVTPNIFGEGSYTVKLVSSDGVQQWVRDDVQFSTSAGQFSDWSTLVTYNLNEIVRASDGGYYISITASNVGNNPVSSASNWSELVFTQTWNVNATYATDDVVLHEGDYYASLTDDNTGNSPLTSRTNWAPRTQPQFSPWSSAYTYEAGNSVERNGKYYRAIVENTGEDPELSADTWTEIAFVTVYNADETYQLNDITTFGGRLYQSLVDDNHNNTPGSSPTQWEDLSLATMSAIKTSLQDRVSDTTLAMDDALFVSVEAGETYQFTFIVLYSANTASPSGFKWDISGTATGLTDQGVFVYAGSGGQDGFGAMSQYSASHICPFNSSPTFYQTLHISGTVTPTTGGTMGLRWAQEVSSADYVRVGQGSTLLVTKL